MSVSVLLLFMFYILCGTTAAALAETTEAAFNVDLNKQIIPIVLIINISAITVCRHTFQRHSEKLWDV